ncbi:MAG: CBS domain-containing protein [Thaumarchaeota archaeon]|nr:CBS domain-containing protein [Nitrososphaerota archaeon]
MEEEEGHLVSDIMNKKVISIDEAKTIKNAANMMNEARIGSIIITKDDTPVGILTERDFVTKIAAKEIPLSTPLSEVMTKPLLVVGPNQTVWEAAEIMKNMEIHRVAVQEGNKIIGMVTTTDLVKIISIGSDSNLHRVADLIFSRQQKQ